MAQIHKFEIKLQNREVFGVVKQYIRPSIPANIFSLNRFFSRPKPVASAPFSINLDLTSACNYRCLHCIDSHIIGRPDMLDFNETAQSLINLRQGGLRSVILIGGGEPTLYKRFVEVVRLIKSLGLQCAIVSNGSMNERVIEAARYLTKGDWIRISLDSGSDELFQYLHRPKTDISLEEICRFVPMIKRENDAVLVGFSFVIISPAVVNHNKLLYTNYHEIEKAALLAKKHCFDYISLKPFLFRNAEGKEIILPNIEDASGYNFANDLKKMILRTKAHSSKTFKIIESTNLSSLLGGKNSRRRRQPRLCYMQAFRQVISPLGIYACPAFRGNIKSLIAQKDGYASVERYLDTAKSTYSHIEKFDPSCECRDIKCIYNSANWWLYSLANKSLLINNNILLASSDDMFL